MNRSGLLAMIAVLLICAATPASAWDPDDEVIADPTPEPPPAVPDGIYLVTETYVDEHIAHDGATTTYTTETVHETTGSYARVLETVGTGAQSALDGLAFNGRAALSDGRAVAGTYYENYIRTDGGYLPVSVVFFQDDLETARAVVLPPVASAPVAPAAPTVSTMPVVPVTPPVSPSGTVAPVLERIPLGPQPVEPPAVVRSAIPPRAFEVLRARRIPIAFAQPGLLRWRLVSGEGVALGQTSGAASDPCWMRWDSLGPGGAAWVIRFALDFADGATREAIVQVTVRAPGLLE